MDTNLNPIDQNAPQDQQGTDIGQGATDALDTIRDNQADQAGEFSQSADYDRMQQIAEVVQRRLGIDDPNDLESWLASKDAEHGEVY